MHVIDLNSGGPQLAKGRTVLPGRRRLGQRVSPPEHQPPPGQRASAALDVVDARINTLSNARTTHGREQEGKKERKTNKRTNEPTHRPTSHATAVTVTNAASTVKRSSVPSRFCRCGDAANSLRFGFGRRLAMVVGSCCSLSQHLLGQVDELCE